MSNSAITTVIAVRSEHKAVVLCSDPRSREGISNPNQTQHQAQYNPPSVARHGSLKQHRTLSVTTISRSEFVCLIHWIRADRKQALAIRCRPWNQPLCNQTQQILRYKRTENLEDQSFRELLTICGFHRRLSRIVHPTANGEESVIWRTCVVRNAEYAHPLCGIMIFR